MAQIKIKKSTWLDLKAAKGKLESETEELWPFDRIVAAALKFFMNGKFGDE